MDANQLSSTVSTFSAKFCNELQKHKSVVSSPLSAEFVLALIALGTTEPAHSELLTTLGISSDDDIRSSFSRLSARIKEIKGVTFNVANRVYVKDGNYNLHPELKEDAVKVFDAGIEKVNFNNAGAAAALINNWVESKTNNRIKNLLSPDAFNEDTRLVLVNALYFKGFWQNQFHARNTMDRVFHVDSNKDIKIPMMYRQGDYRYGESAELNAKLLDIAYKGNEASMLIVLPNEVEGLNGVLQKLADGHDLMGEVNKMFTVDVQVTLPKFKIETEIDLKTLLPKLGIKAIFNQHDSGLTKILDNTEPLYVSKAVQKAFIEVNEEGAEAAAATAMGIMMCSAVLDVEPVRTFVADRPFLATILVGRSPHFTAIYRGEE